MEDSIKFHLVNWAKICDPWEMVVALWDGT